MSAARNLRIIRRFAGNLLLALSFAASVYAGQPGGLKTKSATPKTATIFAGQNVSFTWDENPGDQQINGYVFFEHTASGYTPIGETSLNTFTVADVKAGTHRYVVTAYRSADESQSGYSNEATIEVSAALPPLTPPGNLRRVVAGIANMSTRAQVGVGENVMIGGVIITGATTPVIVRAIGASLQTVGINGALIDPMLELHNADGEIVAQNDNWQDTAASAIAATGIAPKDYREAAIVASLKPGAYTAVLRGKHDTTGVALVEIYRNDSTTL